MCLRTLWNIAPFGRNVKWNSPPHICEANISQRSYFTWRSQISLAEGEFRWKKTNSQVSWSFFWLGCRDSEPLRAPRLAGCVYSSCARAVKLRSNLRGSSSASSTKKRRQHICATFSFWLGCRDSNPGNVRVRVWCLTAWRHPNIYLTSRIITEDARFVKCFLKDYFDFFILFWSCHIISIVFSRYAIKIRNYCAFCKKYICKICTKTLRFYNNLI